jgi:hypothetical protein
VVRHPDCDVGVAFFLGDQSAHPVAANQRVACPICRTPYFDEMIVRSNWLARSAIVFAGMAMAVPVSAQLVQPIPAAGDPSTALSIHLRTLAANPRDFAALMGAGQAALDVGDPNAALGFFARAEELSPSSGRAKAGLASALVQLEKPDDAVRLFGEAVALGVPEANIAADRGLAYDLRGDTSRAQKDYALALRDRPSEDVTRRYALSLGISGEKASALAMLDPLLRRQDQGAWRARAFILAMNDDVGGANTVARQVMPAALAASMAPFLLRLGKLSRAEQAHAVNFGTMPSDGQAFASAIIPEPPYILAPASPKPALRVAQADTTAMSSAMKPIETPRAATPASDLLVPSGQPLGRNTTTTAAPSGSAPLGQRVGARLAPVDPARLPPEARGESVTAVQMAKVTQLPPPDAVRLPTAPPPAQANVQVAQADPKPFETTPAPASIVSPPPMSSQTSTPSAGLIGPPADNAAPVLSPSPPPVVRAPIEKAAVPGSRLASILSGIEPEAESTPVALPTASEIRAAQRVAARKAADAAAAAVEKDIKAREAAAAKENPARLWVQVATGANERALPGTWKRIRDDNAKALKGLGGFSVPFRATNRVLAGPVKSASDARALINALAKNGVTATTYSSEAGQEVVKLAAR